MVKIMVLGSINMDIVAHADHHPQSGETLMGHDLKYFPGGKGSNQAVAASRLYSNVYLIGKLGTDAFGQSMHAFLGQQNLNLDHLMVSNTEPTGIALIILDANSENTIVVVSGSNGHVSASEVSNIVLDTDDIVVSQLEIPQPAIYELFKNAHSNQAITILNAAPAAPLQENLLGVVDYLIVNETELAFFAGTRLGAGNDLIKQAKAIRITPQQKIVVTLGAKGCVCVDGDEIINVSGFLVEAVDTTGAGDCFVGALASGLANGRSLHDALYFANGAAALAVQKEGASLSMPMYDEVETFLRSK